MPTTPNKLAATPGECLDTYIKVQPRYLRSINLARDFYDPDALDGYILTASSLQVFEKVTDGITNPYARAITLTGAYGGGKSAFAMFASRCLSMPHFGSAAARQLCDAADFDIEKQGLLAKGEGYLPVLICGSRRSIAKDIINGVLSALEMLPTKSGKRLLAQLRDEFQVLIDADLPNATAVREFVDTVCREATKSLPDCKGLFIVIDEAGKFLEYAAIHPDKSDIQVVQELAELAVRSLEYPLFFVAILHQSFDEYAHRLGSNLRDEWKKVHGRFQDLPFGASAEEALTLLSRAINCPETIPDIERSQLLTDLIDGCKSTGIKPSLMSPQEFETIVRGGYPIHPIVLRTLPYVFRRFGQSERSLFAFLSSDEANGFQDFLHSTPVSGPPKLYSLDRLYDYMVASMHTAIFSSSTAKVWSEAADALIRLEAMDGIHTKLVKAIGLLQALGEQARLLPSLDLLTFAFAFDGYNRAEIEDALQKLQTNTLITFRQHRKAFKLYEGSDIDVDERVREAQARLSNAADPLMVAAELSVSPPIVARRHSYVTGTLRYFEVRYCRPSEMKSEIIAGPLQADGLLLLCLVPVGYDVNETSGTALELLATRSNVIVGISTETEALRNSAAMVQQLQWVNLNTDQLMVDRVAKREVNERLTEATRAFANEWATVLGPQAAYGNASWFCAGKHVALNGYRDLQVLVSDACDLTFPFTPRLRNEMVNRRQISATAAASRRNLIQAMLEKGDQKRLGIEGYPAEAAMYASILESTGIHRSEGPLYGFHPPKFDRGRPETVEGLSEVWFAIDEFIFRGGIKPKPVTDLFAKLKAAPFGLLDGVIPILLCAVIMHNIVEVAVYEDDRFVVDLDSATFERIVKQPGSFQIQGCRVTGERKLVLSRFQSGLKITQSDATVVEVIRGLYRVFNNLPECTQKTRKLSQCAQTVRDLFKEAKEPERLLFADLPVALGVSAFSEHEIVQDNIDRFFKSWNQTATEIVGYYANVINMIESQLCTALSANDWEELRLRAVNIETNVAEATVKSFIARAANMTITREKWLESVAAAVVGKSPLAWGDQDIDRFQTLLPQTATMFKHAELIWIDKRALREAGHSSLRLAVTTEDGIEYADVAFTSQTDTSEVDDVLNTVQQVLNSSASRKDIRLAVIARLARAIMEAEAND